MLRVGLLIALLLAASGKVQAAQFDKQIPMRTTKAATFYVGGYLDGYGAVDMMVDTGSSYTTINEAALGVLRQNGAVTYVKELTGIMADGTRKVVSIYRIASMSIGETCLLHPGSQRPEAGSPICLRSQAAYFDAQQLRG